MCVYVCFGESVRGLKLHSAGVSWLVACRLMFVHMRKHICALCKQKAPSQTTINRLARLLRHKGLRENADFTGVGGEMGL